MARIDRGWDAEGTEERERSQGASLRGAAYAFERTLGRCRAFPSEDGRERFVVKVTGSTGEPKPRKRWSRRSPEHPLEVLVYRVRDGVVSGAFFATLDGDGRPAFPETGIAEHPFAGNWGGELSDGTKLDLTKSILWELVHGRPPAKIPEVYGHQRSC